ncbi:hypothetical protein Tco_1194095, partial [Tanacetum coccineum]
ILGVAWYKGNLLKGKFVSFREMITSQLQGKLWLYDEAEESQPLGSRVPFTDEEFEASEASGGRTDSSHSSASSDTTTPLSPDHPHTLVSPTPTHTRASFYHRITRVTVRVQPAMSPGLSARVPHAMALSYSAFRKRYRSSYETPSPSPSSTLPIRKRYRGTSELILDTVSERNELGDEDTHEDGEDENDEGHRLDDVDHGLEDEGLGLEEDDEEVPKGQHQAISAANTVVGEPLGLSYEALRCHELAVGEDQAPSTFEVGQSFRSVPEQQGAERVFAVRQPTLDTWVDPEDDMVYTNIPAYVPLAAPVQTLPSLEWSSGSLHISPSSPVVSSPIDLLVATPTATISVDEDQFIEVGAQLELHRSRLHDHIQRLDAPPPTLVTDIDRDVRELYTRLGAVRDEIFWQMYRLRSLDREQDRVAVTFGALWRLRVNHDLIMQLAEERRKRLELADRVARMERRQESREE